MHKPLSLIAILSALALGSPAEAQQPQATAPIYPGPGGAPHYLLGISASGATGDLDKIAAAATALGWPVTRDLDANGKVSLVIGFPNATKPQVDAFLKRASGGEFGALTFESTMAPVAGAAKP